MESWKLLTQEFDHRIHKNLKVQHLAAQYISLTGRYLLPEKEDKSNITMQFIPGKDLLLGRQHPDGWLVSLLLKDLVVQVRNDNMTVLGEVPLEGKTFPEALIEFKKELKNAGADVSLLKAEQPYELPMDSLEEGMFFSTGAEEAVMENIKYRHNANAVLNELRTGYAGACPVYIWPNHFDTGFTFPIEHNREGKETKTLGMGWAIPDDIVDEPYYYLSFLSDSAIDEDTVPGNLAAGRWMMPEWNGAVLKLSEVVADKNAEVQFQMVKTFFESGAQQLIDYFKVSH
ncbi:MAG: hypothetical protein ACOC0R_04775 [Mariniphaga sp.]